MDPQVWGHYKYAFFPSAALAWKVSEEDFIKDSPVISILIAYSLRGYRYSEIPAYGSLSGLGNYAYVVNDAIVNGIR